MADLLARIDHAVAGLCPCGAEPAPGSAYCSEDCRPSQNGPETSGCAWRWNPNREEPTPDEVSLRYITSWSSDSPADPSPAAGAPSAEDRVWRWLRGWWRRGVRRLTGRRILAVPHAVRFAVAPTAVSAALAAERNHATLRALLADEAIYEQALREVRSGTVGLEQMVQRVAAGEWPVREDES